MKDDNPKSAEVPLPDETMRDETIFDATLVPHRSLGPRGISIVIGAVAFVSFCTSLPFFLMGAWPVAGFFGLDVILLYLAFRASARSARAYEHILVTHVDLMLRKVSEKGREQLFHFNPNWSRVETETHEEFGVQRVAVVQGRKQVEVASFLGSEEKEVFAKAFKSALGEARRGRNYN